MGYIIIAAWLAAAFGLMYIGYRYDNEPILCVGAVMALIAGGMDVVS